ncbi:High cysteine membrane protein [Giardia muris]|uniref:High cysteine membrane protein n=1 Tax=Giardia muris TaxID=5742 RepID=A0A4Z1T4K2_GIAMU|nr:High cysteine membrane protein [Giardia muris]|eukprot:TNJ28923.1 High cysteine membrane protein [Giardia muris]
MKPLVLLLLLGAISSNCVIDNCTSCASPDGCQACDSGSFLDSGLCRPCSYVTPYCDLCDPQGSRCYTCRDGYFLDTDGFCHPVDPTCNGIADCATCNGLSCTKCKDGYSLSTSGACTAIGGNCLVKDGTCTVCKPGYFLRTSFLFKSCTKCSTNCELCTSSDKCTKCPGGSFLDSTGSCSNPYPADNCLVPNSTNTGLCQTCFQGYYLKEGKCTLCNDSISNCLLCRDANSCTLCETGYGISGGKCVDATGLTPYCARSVDGVCTECGGDGLYKIQLSTGECAPVQHACPYIGADPNCKFCEKGTSQCALCQTGYSFAGQKCIMTTICEDPNCGVCEASGQCRFCKRDYRLLNNGTCVKKCQDENCYECAPDPTDNKLQVCSGCAPGFTLSEGNCISCGIKGCNTCKLSTGPPAPARLRRSFTTRRTRRLLRRVNEAAPEDRPALLLEIADELEEHIDVLARNFNLDTAQADFIRALLHARVLHGDAPNQMGAPRDATTTPTCTCTACDSGYKLSGGECSTPLLTTNSIIGIVAMSLIAVGVIAGIVTCSILSRNK